MGDHRVRGRYFIACAALVTAIAGTTLTLRGRNLDLNRRANDLNAEVAQLEALRTRLQQIDAESSVIRTKLAEYQRLALPIDATTVVATVGELMPDATVLTEFKLWVTEEAPAKSAIERIKANQKSQDELSALAELKRTLKAEMTGLAESGLDVGVFFDHLDKHPLFKKVSMDFSRVKTVNDRQVREFRISFEINLDARYVTIDPTTKGESM